MKQVADERLAERIRIALGEHPYYGYRRVAIELSVGKHQVRRVMRLYDLHPKPSIHQRHYKQRSGTRPAPSNLVKDEAIIPTRPNELWACDFTYIWCMGRWYYLATVIDVFSREIVGWSMSIHHDTDLILGTLYDALSRQATPQVLHFDRGSEYLSGKHLDLLERLEIRASASAPGSPWQNGFQERFYGSFKTELGGVSDIKSEGELYECIALTLNYYNSRRIHTKLKTNPKQYRQNYEKEHANEQEQERQVERSNYATESIDKVLEKSGA